MASEFTKRQKQKLRELASEAYERELHEALIDLASGFRDWRDEYIDSFDLSERIHDFHQGVSRRLHSQYTGLDSGFLVARAIGLGILSESDVPVAIRRALEPVVSFVRHRYEDPE